MNTKAVEAAALAPCPFCGGDAERLDFETVGTALGNDPNAGGSCITCKRCGASSPVHFDRKENLYSSWNDRAALTAAKAAEDQPHDGLEQLAQFTSAKVRALTAQVAKLTARAERAESEADLLDKSLADVGRKLAEAVKEIRAQTIEECAKVAEQQTETYHEGMSAVDVRLSTTHGPKWQHGDAIANAILSTSPPPPPSEWLPIESAPKDGTCVLIALKNPIPDSKKRLRVWEGRQFVARHPGIDGDGFDAGWSFAAPVGCGGFPDEWIAGWKPLESPPPAEGGER